jgi:hypothetical protein
MPVDVINTGGGGGGGKILLAFILGAVFIAVAVVAFFMWDNYKSTGSPSVPSAIHVDVKGK